MRTRRATLVTCLAIVVHHVSTTSPPSWLAAAPPEQSVCCSTGPVVITTSTPASERTQETSHRISPRLKPAALQQLRLPDVRITSATHHEANEAANVDNLGRSLSRIGVAHVDVEGLIGGTIRFELLLPDQWNNRFVMGGGGGFVGRVSNFARYSINDGYATVGTDTGHQGSGTKAAWALDNVQAQVNFGHVAIHRTAEVARAIITAYYESEPAYSYFLGCSTGGGQALIEAQRYPDDFDGIVSAAPVVSHTGLAAARVYNAQHFFPDANRLDKPLFTEQLLQKLHAAVLSKCDEQDGVKDGILDNPRMCRCDLSEFPGLTAAQRKALQALYDGPRNQHGQIYPGMPLGSEHRWYLWKAGSIPAFLARDKSPNPGFALGIDFCKYFVFNDPNWDYSTYDFSSWQKDTHLAATFLNADNPDLGKLKASGAKLILWHGWSDGPLTPLASINYFQEVERHDPDVRDYFRMYLLPGVTHCRGGAGPDTVDWLAIMAQWVEQGEAPYRLVARKFDKAGQVTMTRPLYPYPLRAVYTGTGDTNKATNFVLPE
ncbi:MAG: tannase/feruloyl esterase family alpha/beta hydrolase [Fuerstiella sp.]